MAAYVLLNTKPEDGDSRVERKKAKQGKGKRNGISSGALSLEEELKAAAKRDKKVFT